MDTNINNDDQSGESLPWEYAFRQVNINRAFVAVGDNNYFTVNIGQAIQPAPPPRGGSPYRGLDAFQKDDSDYFFGRGEVTNQVLSGLANRLHSPGFLVVSGASGAGKSSLLQAGVLPRLHRDGLPSAPAAKSWPCLVITPTSQPLDMLALAVAGLIDKTSDRVRYALEKDPGSFALIAREAVQAQLKATDDQRTGRLILVIDQFEQLFTACTGEAQRRKFIDALHAAATFIGPGLAPAALVVIVVRADFETRCAQYSELTDAIQYRYLLPPITGRQLRNVITGPAENARLSIEEGLVRQLLDEVGVDGATGTVSSPGVLPLLSHALAQTWLVHQGPALTLANYEETGGIEKAVERSATAAYSSLTVPQRNIARLVFIMLTSVSADNKVTSVPRTKAELSAGIGEAKEGSLQAVLDAFAHPDRRLLTLSDNSVAIAHEVLIQTWPLLHDEWLAEDSATQKILIALRDTAADWDRDKHNPAYLYTGSRLAVAMKAAALSSAEPTRFPRLTEPANEFLARSYRLEQRRVRLRHRIIAVLAALVIGLAAITVWANQERNAANAERDAYTSEALDAQSQANRDYNPSLAEQKALAAWAIKPADAVADYTILDEAANLQWNAALGTGGTSEGWVTYSPNGKLLAVRTDDGVHLWNAATHQALYTYLVGNGNGYDSVAFRADGKRLAVVSNQTIELWSTTAPYKRISSLAMPSENDEYYSSVAFSQQGNLVAAGAIDDNTSGGIRIWNTTDHNRSIFLPVSSDAENIGSVAFSPNGKYLAVITGNSVELWNISTLWSVNPLPQAAVLDVGNDDNDSCAVGAPTFSQDSSQLAVAIDNGTTFDEGACEIPDHAYGTIRIWSTGSAGQQPITFDAAGGAAVGSATFNSKDGLLAVTTSNGVQLWGISRQAGTLTYEQADTLAAAGDAAVYSAAFSPDGKVLAVATSTGVWLTDPVTDLLNGHPSDFSLTGEGPASTVALNRDGSLLAIASTTGEIQVVNTATGRRATLPNGGGTSGGASVVFSPDGALLAAATGKGVWVWSTAAIWGKDPSVRRMSNVPAYAVGFSPDGKYLAAAVGTSTLMWATKNLKRAPRSQSAPAGSTSVSVAFSPNSKLLVAATDNGSEGPGTGTIQEWPTGKFGRVTKPFEQPNNYDDPDYSLTFSPDGKYLAVGGNEMTQILSSATLKPTTQPISGWLTAFSPDGSIVSVENDNGVELLDLNTGQVIDTLPVSEDFGVLYLGSIPVTFSADGNELAAITGDSGGEIQLWHLSYLGTSVKDTVSYLCKQLDGQSLTADDWSTYASGVPYRNACS
ncbi:MAG: hypothetical protein ABSA93_27470 [Streptosporangiaceae bacterium]